METMWAWVAGACGGIVLVWNAVKAIINFIATMKAPNARQNEEIKDLKERMADVEKKLSSDKDRFDEIERGNRVVQAALLALLDHGMDGNNIDQMKAAKEALQAHLINK